MNAVTKKHIDTWFQDEDEEEGMFEDHAYMWRHMIDAVHEKDFSRFQVLDYGCNRGGFLRTLFEQRPFRRGLGVDVAQASLAVAREACVRLPVEFATPDRLDRYADAFDIAFSHEVLYLLLDLDAHADVVARSLKNGGAYYAAIGCHTGNPLWGAWRGLIAQSTNLPVFDYSLDDYARAFRKAGLRVEMRPFALQDFILIKPDNAYFPKAEDSLDYHVRVKTLIRACKAE